MHVVNAIIFIVTSLPAVVKALRDLWNLVDGDKAKAQETVKAMCDHASTKKS